MPSYLFVLLYLTRCLVYHMLFKREETLEVYTVISEVLVLGLLVVVYKIPYSSCRLNQQSY